MIRECSSVTSLNFLKNLKEVEPPILYNNRCVKNKSYFKFNVFAAK